MKEKISSRDGVTGPAKEGHSSGTSGLPLQGEYASRNRGYTSERISFNRKIVAASAARFMNQFLETLKSGMGFGDMETFPDSSF